MEKTKEDYVQELKDLSYFLQNELKFTLDSIGDNTSLLAGDLPHKKFGFLIAVIIIINFELGSWQFVKASTDPFDGTYNTELTYEDNFKNLVTKVSE